MFKRATYRYLLIIFFSLPFSSTSLASDGLSFVNLNRCTTGYQPRDLMTPPKFESGRTYLIRDASAAAIRGIHKRDGFVFLQSPLATPGLPARGMRIELSDNGKYVRATFAGGFRQYFQVKPGTLIKERLEIIPVDPDAKVTSLFIDYSQKRKEMEAAVSEGLRSALVLKNTENPNQLARDLALAQILGSGQRDSEHVLNDQDAKKAHEQLIKANSYALHVSMPFSLEDVAFINKLVLEGDNNPGSAPGHIRGQKGEEHNLETRTALFASERSIDNRPEEHRYLYSGEPDEDIEETFVGPGDVPYATLQVLSAAARLKKNSLGDILLVYRDLMLIHPVPMGVSRTVRPIVNRLLIDSGYSPFIKGKWKDYFLYYSADEFVYFVLKNHS